VADPAEVLDSVLREERGELPFELGRTRGVAVLEPTPAVEDAEPGAGLGLLDRRPAPEKRA
jgi:hypothetical protein